MIAIVMVIIMIIIIIPPTNNNGRIIKGRQESLGMGFCSLPWMVESFRPTLWSLGYKVCQEQQSHSPISGYWTGV